MRKSEEKKKLVSELTSYYKSLNAVQLHDFPDHKVSKDWLAEVAALLKNLDESDYQEFMRLRKSLYPGVERRIRINATNEIDGFVRQKVAEYQRCDFTYLDKKSINFPRIEFPKWIVKNLEKIVVSLLVTILGALALTLLRLK